MPRNPLKNERAIGDSVQVETVIAVTRRERARPGAKKAAPTEPNTPKIPRLTRLMALAIKFQDKIDRGELKDYAEIADLGYVTRARVTQIMNLTLLAPEIQEFLLFSIETRAVPPEREMRQVAQQLVWATQRCLIRVLDPAIMAEPLDIE